MEEGAQTHRATH